jgi:hypothetical protein
MTEIEASNKENIKIKAMRREEEKVLEQQIVEYQKAKDLIERQKVEEALRLAAEKEKEIQRLRALQEKANDR